MDIDMASSVTQLSANWTASIDAESGIASYQYCISTSPNCSGIVLTNWTDNGTNLSVTKTGLALTDGVVYYFSVRAENGAGLMSTVSSSDGAMIDATAPSAITTVNDGNGLDIDTTSSASQLLANWTASSDPQSGVVRYWYAIGTAQGATDVKDWTSAALELSMTLTGLELTNGVTYYVSVKAENGAGLMSTVSSSDGVLVVVTDVTPPSSISTVNDGTGEDIDTTETGTGLSANWSESTDAESGIAHYWYAIGTSAGGTNVIDWTDNDLNLNVTVDGLILSEGMVYYFSVRAENGDGLLSNTASSDGLLYSKVGEDPVLDPGGWNQLGSCKKDMTFDVQEVFGTATVQIVKFENGGYVYLPVTGTITLDRGTGYFIITADSPEILLPDTGTEMIDDTYSFTLSEGWNLFANPFCHPLAWGRINAELTCGGVPQDDLKHNTYRYNGKSGYERISLGDGHLLLPWYAYFIKSPEDGCILELTDIK